MGLKITGTVLTVESEVIEYTSKKTGNAEKLNKSTICVQGDFGVMICNAFNPKVDISTIKPGGKLNAPISKYEERDGVQLAVLRI